MSATANWEHYGYVKSSKYRLAVMRELADGVATPTEIADASGADITHISRALNRLRDRDIVELRVPEDTKKGRYYGLTNDGRDLHRVLDGRDDL